MTTATWQEIAGGSGGATYQPPGPVRVLPP